MLLDIGEQIARQTSPIINGNVLIAHGDCDKITSFEASKRFFDRLAVPKHCAKESLFIENGCHERTVYAVY